MKKKINYIGVLPALLIAGSLVLTGCADNDYDLSDMDTTIAVGSNNGIALPTNSTHIIKLSDLIELEDDGVIKLDDKTGVYYFYQEGQDIEPGNPSVDKILVARQSITEHDVTLEGIDQDALLQSIADQFHTTVDFIKANPSMIPSDPVPLPTPIHVKGYIQVFDFQTQQNDAVMDLDTVFTKGDFDLSIWFNDKVRNAITKIDQINIAVPSYMKVTTNNKAWNEEKHQFEFKDVYTNRTLQFSGNIEQLYDFQSSIPSDESRSYLVSNSDIIKMKGYVDVDIVISSAKIKVENGAYDDMTVKSQMAMSGNVEIAAATGKFNPDVNFNTFSYIQIDDVPDFLNDPAVKLEISKPELRVSVESDIDLDGMINLAMTSEFTDQPNKTIKINDIKLHRNSTTNVLICNSDIDEEGVDEYKEDLHELLTRIPHRIKMEVTGSVDKTKTGHIELGKTYNFKPSKYIFKAPLALTDNSQIVYNDTINGWNEDLKDIDLYFDAKNHPYVELTARIHNGLPFKLTASGTAIGDNLSALSGMQVIVKTDQPNNQIAASDVTDITIRIEQTEKGAFKKLDGITLRAEAIPQGNADAPLNGGNNYDTDNNSIEELISAKAQVLKLDNISAKIVGKIIVSEDK